MENYNFTSTDYKNALWGKDIYTSKGLMARADILLDVFPEISKEFHNLESHASHFQSERWSFYPRSNLPAAPFLPNPPAKDFGSS